MTKYISILPITLYLIYIVWRFYKKKGLPKSISESYYWLIRKERWIFVFALISTSLLMAGTYIYNHEEIKLDSILLFFAALGICYTASAARFKKSTIINTWHLSGAIGGFAFGYAFIVARFGWDSLLFIVPSAVLCILVKYHYKYRLPKPRPFVNKETIKIWYKDNPDLTIWWAEIIGLVTIYLATL